MDSEQVLLRVTEAAQRLAISRATAYTLIAHGDLRSVKLGGARRIHVRDIEAFVERLREQAAK